MYFENINIIQMDELINNDYKFYAHKKCNEDENQKKVIFKEHLKDHTQLCLSYFNKIYKSKKLETVFLNFEKCYLKDMSNEGIKVFREIFINTIAFHDIGKINPYFQIRTMDNLMKEEPAFSSLGSRHSLISSVLYIDYYLDKILSLEDKKEKMKLRTILFINAYIISKHHGDLDEFCNFLSSFIDGEDGVKDPLNVIDIFETSYTNVYLKKFNLSCKKAERQCKNTRNFINKITMEESIYLYTYSKLIFSLLVACDYYATTEFMNEVEIKDFGDINEIDEIYNIYKDTSVYKSIREYEKHEYKNSYRDLANEKNINILRNEMFLDSEKELKANKDKNIFFLEAPTGSVLLVSIKL